MKNISTEEKILMGLSEYPNLDAEGLVDGQPRADKPINPREFELALLWLRLKGRMTQRVVRRQSSYGLKHRASSDLNHARHDAPFMPDDNYYISNGALICAAAYLGYTIQRVEGTPNAFMNIGRVV
jgi:hypothetical protein